MPFAELKGVTFTEAEKDRVVARMLVRPDLCTLGNTLHGGAIMALADSVGAAATVINLPEDAKGTTTSRRRRWCCSRANAARSQPYAGSAVCTAFNIPVLG
jgi:uncharacterized protein (TIGR00369 family)